MSRIQLSARNSLYRCYAVRSHYLWEVRASVRAVPPHGPENLTISLIEALFSPLQATYPFACVLFLAHTIPKYLCRGRSIRKGFMPSARHRFVVERRITANSLLQNPEGLIPYSPSPLERGNAFRLRNPPTCLGLSTVLSTIC